MKTIIPILILLGMTSYVYPQTDTETLPQKNKISYATLKEKRTELWKAFHKIRFKKFGEFQDIDLYAEDDTLTRICFICDKGLFIFYWEKSEGRIKKIEHAKMMVYNKINRITHETNNTFRVFKLWHYETEVLSLGAN